MNPEPTAWDVHHVLQETPQTFFLTVSRRAASLLNGFAVESLFGDAVPLGVFPTDPESNLANYQGSSIVAETPLEQAIYKGMRIILTKNLNKEVGFVNGNKLGSECQT